MPVSPPLPTGIITFLFTDIVGSTTMVRRLGRAFEDVLDEHNRIVRSAISGAGGTEVRTEGDSFFAVFTTPSACIEAALGAQRALQSHDWREGGRVEVRMGAHTGEGRLGGGDYVGLDVHRAARIAAAAHGGQILVSEATKSLAVETLGAGVGFRDLGEYRLKDLGRAERIFQLVASDLPFDFPPLRTADVPTNLPVLHSEFVGRHAETDQIIRLLAENRLVTLTGVGGTGKTRLAVHVAASVTDRFQDGVYFVGLEDVDDAGGVPGAIARAVGAPGDMDPMTAITAAIGSGSVLLVVDNLEQVIGAAPRLSELLAACAGLTVLATSRTLLHVRGEHVYPVPPLGLPRDRSTTAVKESDSGSLFVRRVRATDPDFELDAGGSATVASIVRRLDGLPLAIELAAARVRLFGLEGLLEELDSRLGDLDGGYVDAPERHRTLRAAIDWSYRLLGADEEALLRRASVFAGGFTLRAADAVCGGQGVPETGHTLASLIDKSLVRSTVTAGTARFSMLEAIRVYAQDRLDQSGEADAGLRAHAEYYTTIARQGADSLHGPDAYSLMERLTTERANVEAALRWATDHDPDLGLAAMLVLARFYEVSGSLDEGRRLAERLLQAPGSSASHRLTGLLGAASMAYWLIDYAAAESLYQAAISLADNLGDTFKLGEGLLGLAYTYVWMKRIDDAEAAVERAGPVVDAGADATQALHLAGVRGTCQWMRGDLVGSMHSYADVLDRAKRIGDVNLQLSTELVLVGGLARAGLHDEAVPKLLHVLERYEQLSDEAGATRTLDYLSVPMAVLRPRDGVRLAGFVESVTQARGGSIRMSTLGMPDPRRLAEASLESDELHRLWQEGSKLDVAEALQLVKRWTEEDRIVPEPVDPRHLVRMIEDRNG